MIITDLLLGAITTFTSTVTALFGLGGGLLLIGFLPGLLPASIIIPIHGTTQLVSNVSRACFAYRSIEWRLVPQFVAGSLAGILLFGVFLSTVPNQYIPVTIGLYILLSLWNKQFDTLMRRFENIYVIGFLQTGLSLFVGATGPLATAMLLKKLKAKEQIVTTNAVFMSISHTLKIVLFGFLGFQFMNYLTILCFMIGGATLGSFIGTKYRQRIHDQRFAIILKLLLTGLATKMIVLTLV